MDALDVSSLPPGFGFHPTDVELVSHYLKKKILGVKFELEVIPEVDIYKHEPWDLPGKTRVQSRDGKWHFFNTRDRKYPNGFRSNRATEAGYWKSTGKDRLVRSRNRVIGTKKTLVFHKGRPPSGKRTDWIMHEYYLNDSECKAMASGNKDLFVLCRITKRNPLATEDDDSHTHVEVKSDPCSSGGNASSADAQRGIPSSVANAQDMPTFENINCEDWIRELYDPNFLLAPNLVDCTTEKEVETISPPTHCELNGSSCIPPDTERDSLLRAIDLHYVDQVDNNFLEELNYWASLDANAFVQSQLTMDSTNKNENDYAQHLSIKAEDIVEELGQSVSSHPTDTSVTGIHIKERSIPTFNEAPVHRIRLQVHKTQAKNAESTNHTVMLEAMNHRLDLNEPIEQEISKKFAACSLDSFPTIKKEIIFKEPPAEAEQFGPNPEESFRKHEECCNFNSKQWKLPSDREWKGRCRPSIRGLARQVLRDARVRMKRYSPVSMNCLFLGGTCLTGAAFSGYIFEETGES